MSLKAFFIFKRPAFKYLNIKREEMMRHAHYHHTFIHPTKVKQNVWFSSLLTISMVTLFQRIVSLESGTNIFYLIFYSFEALNNNVYINISRKDTTMILFTLRTCHCFVKNEKQTIDYLLF